jgi:hypothetical protein
MFRRDYNPSICWELDAQPHTITSQTTCTSNTLILSTHEHSNYVMHHLTAKLSPTALKRMTALTATLRYVSCEAGDFDSQITSTDPSILCYINKHNYFRHDHLCTLWRSIKPRCQSLHFHKGSLTKSSVATWHTNGSQVVRWHTNKEVPRSVYKQYPRNSELFNIQ